MADLPLPQGAPVASQRRDRPNSARSACVTFEVYFPCLEISPTACFKSCWARLKSTTVFRRLNRTRVRSSRARTNSKTTPTWLACVSAPSFLISSATHTASSLRRICCSEDWERMNEPTTSRPTTALIQLVSRAAVSLRVEAIFFRVPSQRKPGSIRTPPFTAKYARPELQKIPNINWLLRLFQSP